MDLAFIKQKYEPFGGGERYLQRLMEAARDTGCRVHILTTSWPGGSVPGIEPHVLPIQRRSRASRVRSFAAAVRRELNSGHFDASVSLERTGGQDIWRAGEGVHRIWLERRQRIEPRWRNRLTGLSPGHRALLALERAAVTESRRIITNSHMVKRDIEQVYGAQGDKIAVIHNGLDLQVYAPDGRAEHAREIRSELGLPDDARLLLFAGSGFVRKGLPQVLAALPDDEHIHLVVAGRDRTEPWLKRVRHMHLHNRVHFTGPRKDLIRLYHAADGLVLPSWFDPFPNVGLEALACGTPVITSRFCGTAELIQDTNGSVIDDPDDLSALQAAMRRWAGRPAPPDAARAIAATVANLSIQSHVRKTLDLIHETVQERDS